MQRAPAVVLVTFPTADEAIRVARTLVAERLVACVNVLPGVQSIYAWQGTVEEGSEVLAVLKTAGDRIAELQRRVLELHAYDTPEFVVLVPEHVEPRYLAWLMDATEAGNGAITGS